MVRYSAFMQITLACVASRPPARDSAELLVGAFLERCAGFARCGVQFFAAEAAALSWIARQSGRTQPAAVLLDSRGRALSSEAFAAWIGARRDQGIQHLIFAIGPHGGWSEEARSRAQLLLSLGPMTLAHALARMVLAEQIYRATTILTGHPYHLGH